MNNSKRRVHVAATALLCALVVILAIGVIAQQLAASRLSDGIQVQKQLLAKSKEELQDRAKWRNDYGDLSLKLGGRVSACSWSDQMPFMVAQVSGIVEANGLKIENLQPEPMTSSGSIQRFPMRLVLQTDLKHLTELLKDMSGSSPLLDVERLEVRNAQGETGKLQVNMTVASFVVLDKSSPIGRRRTVTPVKESKEPAKPASKPAVKSAEPAAKPEARQPQKSVSQPPTAGPNARREAPEHQRRDGAEPPRMDRPANGNGGKSGAPEAHVDGKTTPPPAAMDAESMGIRRMPKDTNGGAK